MIYFFRKDTFFFEHPLLNTPLFSFTAANFSTHRSCVFLGRRRAPPAPSPQLPPSARPPTFLVTASRIFARGQVLQLPTGLSCSDILPLPQRRTLFNSFPLMTLLLLDGPLTLPLARARTCKCRGVYAAFLKHMQQEHLKMLKTPRATRQVRELHGMITPTAQRGLSVEAAGNPTLGT